LFAVDNLKKTFTVYLPKEKFDFRYNRIIEKMNSV